MIKLLTAVLLHVASAHTPHHAHPSRDSRASERIIMSERNHERSRAHEVRAMWRDAYRAAR